MAKARKYSINREALENGKGKKYISSLKGQAKTIFNFLLTEKNPELAQDLTNRCPDFETRQSKYRVVLYYILIFKSKGLISTFEDIEVEIEEKIEPSIFPSDEEIADFEKISE